MLAILDILNFIVELVKFIVNMVVNILTVAFTAIKTLVVIFAALPTLLQVFLIAIVGVSIVYKIISLGGSGDS